MALTNLLYHLMNYLAELALLIIFWLDMILAAWRMEMRIHLWALNRQTSCSRPFLILPRYKFPDFSFAAVVGTL